MVDAIKHCLRLGLQFSIFAIMTVEFMSLRLIMSKAFDRVNHFGLLYTLLKKGLPLCLINILLSWFSKLCGSVSWNGKISASFNIASGVPQRVYKWTEVF
jgi:hypothetical protein